MKIFQDNYKQIRLGFKKIEWRAPRNSEPGKTFSEMKCGDLITFKAVSREDKKSLRRRGLLKFYLIIVIMNEHRRNQLIKC